MFPLSIKHQKVAIYQVVSIVEFVPSDKTKIHASNISVTRLTQAAIFRSGRLYAEFTIRLKRAEIPEYLAPLQHCLYNIPKISHYLLRYWLLCTFRHITHTPAGMVHGAPEGPLLPAPVSAAGTYTIEVSSIFIFIFLINVLILLCNFEPRSINSAFEFI
jgi:hypothetical protein